MAMEEKGTNRLWHLLARKMADEISPEEESELSGLLQTDPYALYTQEILNGRWKDSYQPMSSEQIRTLLEKHRRRLLTPVNDIRGENIPGKNTAAGNMLAEPVQAENIPAERLRPSRRSVLIRYAVASAACLLLAVAGWKWLAQPPVPREVNLKQLVTENGSRSQLSLPDGSKVWLNAGSRLEYPDRFNGNSREVTLIGEAFFDVVKDSLRPFLVHTRTFHVRVLGTSFNVRAYEEEEIAETSLIQGSVQVLFGQGNDSRNIVVLKPNEKLMIPTRQKQASTEEPAGEARPAKPEALRVSKAPVTNMEDAENTIAETAWVYNKLAFKNTSFDKIAESLEKWFGVTILFRNGDKRSLRLSGTFEGEGLDEILSAFQSTGKSFHYGRDHDGTIWIE